jgi:hypothetical protein
MRVATKRFRSLTDTELIDLLYTAGDRLPRDAVEEILRRGDRLLPYLHDLVADKSAWTQPLPEWWAPVHATYILGAMDDPNALLPLFTALRWADAFDCDWITEDLPCIFARTGPMVFEPLAAIARDPTSGPGARSIALASMAAVAVALPHLRHETIGFSARIVADGTEDYYFRQTAANLLLDFRSSEHRDLLLAFGREETLRKRADPEYRGVFYDWEVDERLHEGAGAANLEYYQRDWLDFYDPEEIEARQERWQKEQEDAEKEQVVEAHMVRGDIRSPCPCGSGRPFADCCYLKVH